jgi:hypothetical protein
VIAAWELATRTGAVPSFLLLPRGRGLAALIDGDTNPIVLRHFMSTLQATALGYAVGGSVALLLAALIAEFRPAERFLLLPLTAVQAVPKVSVAPLIFLWAGFGLERKVVLVALICFPGEPQHRRDPGSRRGSAPAASPSLEITAPLSELSIFFRALDVFLLTDPRGGTRSDAGGRHWISPRGFEGQLAPRHQTLKRRDGRRGIPSDLEDRVMHPDIGLPAAGLCPFRLAARLRRPECRGG